MSANTRRIQEYNTFPCPLLRKEEVLQQKEKHPVYSEVNRVEEAGEGRVDVLQSAGASLLGPPKRRAALCRTTRSTPSGQIRIAVGDALPGDRDDRRGIQLCRRAIAHAEPVVGAFRDVETQTAVRIVDLAKFRNQRRAGIGNRLVPPLAQLSLVRPDLHVERARLAVGVGDLGSRC